MSSFVLNESERTTLCKGLKFCPTPDNFDNITNKNDTSQFCRKLRLTEFFHGIDNNDSSIVKGKSNFTPTNGRNDFLDSVVGSIKNLPQPKKKTTFNNYNITYEERKALDSLRQREDLIIKEADKGSSVVIMDRSFYITQAEIILNDSSAYQQIGADDDHKLMKKICRLADNYKSELTENEVKFITNFEYKTSNLYCLPKVHKSILIKQAIEEQQSELVTVRFPCDLQMRPIVAGPACPTHRLSNLLDVVLRPLVQGVTSNVRDTMDLLDKLPPKIDEDFQFAIFDVENLYGNISHSLGLRAIQFWLQTTPLENSRISNNFILEALRLILENNNFFFNGNFYRQLRGTAMGTKVAPVYATLTLGYLEKFLYSSINSKYGNNMYNFFINNYYRFLDDVLLIFDSNILNVSDLSEIMNNLDPDMNFKLESSGRTINFLDIEISAENGCVVTDIFYKPTDSKQYLDFHSHHPRHVKIALPYNLSRRICTIVSDRELRKKRLLEMKQCLVRCRYPKELIDDGIKRALQIDRSELIKPKLKEPEGAINSSSIVHVSTYSSNFHNNDNLIKNLFQQLTENKSTAKIFNNKRLLLAKRQPPNLKSLLTGARLTDIDCGGVFKCNSPRCQLCDIIITGSSIVFHPNNFKFSIKCNMTCNSKNCLYVVECQGCKQMYIGETNNLRLRTNLHRDHSNKNIGLGVSRHIFSCTRTISSQKFHIMPFYKMSSDDSVKRRTMEEYFIKKLKPQLNNLPIM